MGLFDPPRPKGITKDELKFVRSELLNAPFGHGAEALSERQVDEIIEDLQLAMDPDSPVAVRKNWEQAGPEEVEEIEEKAANGKGMKFTEKQLGHIHKVLGKYVEINRLKSIF
jgi:hypothetical protein